MARFVLFVCYLTEPLHSLCRNLMFIAGIQQTTIRASQEQEKPTINCQLLFSEDTQTFCIDI